MGEPMSDLRERSDDVERVAIALFEHEWNLLGVPWGDVGPDKDYWLAAARAAIRALAQVSTRDVVVEECAKVADAHHARALERIQQCEKRQFYEEMGMNQSCAGEANNIAAAIRALAAKEPGNE